MPIDPIADAKRIVEHELADKGFVGYNVSARQTASQIVVSVSKKGDTKVAEGTEEMLLKAIAQAHSDGVTLEEEFDSWNMYS